MTPRQVTPDARFPPHHELIYDEDDKHKQTQLLTVRVKLPPHADLARVKGLVESTCRSRGLSGHVKTSLKSYPGSVHWHFKKGDERGVIEVTFWEGQRRLWINVHSNRTGPWTTDEVRGLKADLEKRLRR